MKLLAILALQAQPPATHGDWPGKAAFIGVFLVLVVVLVLLPARLTGETGGVIPWWRRVRFWAILVALTQIAIYAWWG